MILVMKDTAIREAVKAAIDEYSEEHGIETDEIVDRVMKKIKIRSGWI